MITEISFLLVIISSVIHPLWNMLLKKSEDKVIFYLNIHLFYTLAFCFILFLYPLKDVSIAGWVLVIVSACTHFFYQIFLCKTYEGADMSLSYPIIRSSPVFVLLMAFILLGEVPSKIAILGIIVVMLGAYLINQKKISFSGILDPFRHINKKVVFFAGLTAFSSACYSVVDKKGVLLMHPILFFYLFFALSGFLFLGYLLFMKERRRNYFYITKKDKFSIALAAVLEFLSYILILYAFRMSKVAYVIALRQISVVFGSLYGILFLKEKYAKVRFAGAVIIFIGIYLIAAFG
ncbi:MAG: DMT family transporter [Candidatus Omnitrophota bacterium]